MVMSGDVALSKPAFVRSEDGRNQAPSRPDDLRIAADGVGTADQVKDSIDAVGMMGVQRIYHVNSLGVVHLLGSEITRLVDVTANGRDDMCAAGASHLHRV